jgi:hypothetical protein
MEKLFSGFNRLSCTEFALMADDAVDSIRDDRDVM